MSGGTELSECRNMALQEIRKTEERILAKKETKLKKAVARIVASNLRIGEQRKIIKKMEQTTIELRATLRKKDEKILELQKAASAQQKQVIIAEYAAGLTMESCTSVPLCRTDNFENMQTFEKTDPITIEALNQLGCFCASISLNMELHCTKPGGCYCYERMRTEIAKAVIAFAGDGQPATLHFIGNEMRPSKDLLHNQSVTAVALYAMQAISVNTLHIRRECLYNEHVQLECACAEQCREFILQRATDAFKALLRIGSRIAMSNEAGTA